MCRSIKQLRPIADQPPAGPEEIRAAALQYVRKVSGYLKPSQANQVAFDQAVEQVAEATRRLLDTLQPPTPPQPAIPQPAVHSDQAAARAARAARVPLEDTPTQAPPQPPDDPQTNASAKAAPSDWEEEDLGLFYRGAW